MYIIGLVGPFGSGCSYVAKKIVANHEYKLLSLSDVLKEEFHKIHPNKKTPTRKELQDFGNELRKNNGSNYLACKVCDKINQDSNSNYVVDSIRNPEEIDDFRKNYAGFFLFGIFTSTFTSFVTVMTLLI